MTAQTPKEAIAEALQTFDHTNDALWTDDGAPLVDEVRRVCNDKTISRGQINDALPGFVRKSQDSNTEEVQPEDEIDDGIDPITGMAKEEQPPALAAAQIEPTDEVVAENLSQEEEYQRLRAIAQGRVDKAEAAVTAAKDAVSVALRAVSDAEQRHTRALQFFASKYPPLTAAANIQQHLARQQEILRERVTGSRFEPNVAQNPVDATLMNRKRDNGRNNNKGAAFLPLSTGG